MPIAFKSKDIITYDGKKYLVTDVSLSQDGPLVEAVPLGEDSLVIHADEIELNDGEEQKLREEFLNDATDHTDVIAASSQIFRSRDQSKRLSRVKFSLPVNIDDDSADEIALAMEDVVVETKEVFESLLRQDSEYSRLSLGGIVDRFSSLIMDFEKAVRHVARDYGEVAVNLNEPWYKAIQKRIEKIKRDPNPLDVRSLAGEISKKFSTALATIPGYGYGYASYRSDQTRSANRKAGRTSHDILPADYARRSLTRSRKVPNTYRRRR